MLRTPRDGAAHDPFSHHPIEVARWLRRRAGSRLTTRRGMCRIGICRRRWRWRRRRVRRHQGRLHRGVRERRTDSALHAVPCAERIGDRRTGGEIPRPDHRMVGWQDHVRCRLLECRCAPSGDRQCVDGRATRPRTCDPAVRTVGVPGDSRPGRHELRVATDAGARTAAVQCLGERRGFRHSGADRGVRGQGHEVAVACLQLRFQRALLRH